MLHRESPVKSPVQSLACAGDWTCCKQLLFVMICQTCLEFITSIMLALVMFIIVKPRSKSKVSSLSLKGLGFKFKSLSLLLHINKKSENLNSTSLNPIFFELHSFSLSSLGAWHSWTLSLVRIIIDNWYHLNQFDRFTTGHYLKKVVC